MKKVITILVVMVLSISLVACSEPKPADVLDKLETAYNKQDIYAIIECYEPNVKKFLSGAASLAGMAGLTDVLPLLSTALGSELDMGFGKITLTEISTEMIDKSTAMLYYNVSIVYSDGQTANFDSSGKVVKVDKEWYIAAF